MKSCSIYRGQARSGIGEGPGRPVHHGEQFLAADPPLDQDGELLAATRPWMTLDWRPADEQALGERIEAWSCFPHGELRFVVRLVAAGTYDRRAAYFAHGRAFSVNDIAGARDPGAYLGLSAAFDEPWRDGRRTPPRSPGPPEMVRPDQVLAEPAVAGALLAHLYQALLGGYPVVMAVPVSDFEAGGPLHALVSFARAALPLALKCDCRIRVFTRLPEIFLRHQRADLVVVPESEAANALAARRDATLLDRRGSRREGRDFSPAAGRYAEAILQRINRLPAGLLAFSGAIGEHFPKDRLPDEQELARVPVLYNLLAARAHPVTLAEWIESSLLKQVSERPTGLDWERLIRPEDWRGIPFGSLAGILLAEVAGEEAAALLQQAEAEARRPERQEVIAEERLRSRWNDLAVERRAALLARLLGSPQAGRPLVASVTAARLSASLSLPALLASGAAARLLDAELEAGLLHDRARDPAGLAEAVNQDLLVAGVLTRATETGILPPDWMLRLLEQGDPVVLGVAAAVLPSALASLHWRPCLGHLFERLLAIPKLPSTLWPALDAALARNEPVDPLSEPDDGFVLTELLVRSESPRCGQAVARAWRLAETLAGLEERRVFLRRVADPRWRSLEPGRLVSRNGAELALSWAASFPDLLLGSEEIRDQLPTGLLLRLAGTRSDIGGWLDPRMKVEPTDTVNALLRAGRWGLWRSGSLLQPEGLHQAGLAWMTSDIWQAQCPPQAFLEDWKRVAADLGELSGSEMACLCAGRRPLWPWIPPFQDEQLRDLCRLVRSDLGALAELAEGLDPRRDLGYPIPGTIFEHVLAQGNPALRDGLPAGSLVFLGATPGAVLPPREARLLFERTHHRRNRALAGLRKSILEFLDSQPSAALQAAEWLLSQKDGSDLRDDILRWRKKQPPRKLEGEVGAILGRLLPVDGQTAKAAPGGRPALEPAIQALLQGATDHGCWKKLEAEIRSYVSSKRTEIHPVSRLVERLHESFSQLRQQDRDALRHQGWRTFSYVTRSHRLVLRQPVLQGAPLPALQLSALLLPGLGVGRAALNLLFLDAARDHATQTSWWESLLAGIARPYGQDGLHQPLNREEIALHLVFQAIPDLPSSEEKAARSALETHMDHLYRQRGLPLAQVREPQRELQRGTLR